MPKVTCKTDGSTAECKAGASLQEVAHANGFPIPFGCENGLCGTCLIQIGSGMEHLNEKTEQEEFTLEARDAEPNMRLACQCQINGDIEFEV